MAGEYCFAITQAVGSHTSAIQVPLCQNLDLNWTVLYICRYVCMCILYVCMYVVDHVNTQLQLAQNSSCARSSETQTLRMLGYPYAAGSSTICM